MRHLGRPRRHPGPDQPGRGPADRSTVVPGSRTREVGSMGSKDKGGKETKKPKKEKK
jgi:hypothetical protein